MSRARRPLMAAVLTAATVAALLSGVGNSSVPAQAAEPKPLAGKVVLLDPGHQLGNATHLRQIGRKVDAGGLTKACNTVGARTAGGFPESTFTMSVALHLRARLRAQGATVHLTRSTEAKNLWGPCVDVRGRRAGQVHADVLVSVHADSTPARHRGFFVIRPAYRRGITDDIHRSSQTLSRHVRSGLDRTGLPRANYYGGDALDTRADLGTLNLSSAPAVMVELGNMRNGRDAALMTSDRSRDALYAAGLARGISSFLRR